MLRVCENGLYFFGYSKIYRNINDYNTHTQQLWHECNYYPIVHTIVIFGCGSVLWCTFVPLSCMVYTYAPFFFYRTRVTKCLNFIFYFFFCKRNSQIWFEVGGCAYYVLKWTPLILIYPFPFAENKTCLGLIHRQFPAVFFFILKYTSLFLCFLPAVR